MCEKLGIYLYTTPACTVQAEIGGGGECVEASRRNEYECVLE